jgi:hypothetical protein
MKKRRRFKMLSISKRRKRPDFKNNLRNKMSKRNYRIIIGLNKKIK